MKTLKLTLFVFSAMAWGTVWAAPGLINYQGRLTDSSGNAITVATNVTFTFYDAETTGTQLGSGFSDTDSVTPDANGIYSTDIGDDPGNPIPASVFSGDSVWLNVNVGGEDLVPRLRIESAGFAIHAASAKTASTASNSAALQGLPASAFLHMSSYAYVVVKTVTDSAQNGANLLAAYATAKSLTPNWAPLSATNRAVVLVPPGNYDLGTGELTLDTEFVDLIGLSSKRDDQYIYGATNGSGTGVIHQTANNVAIENLLVQSTTASGTLPNDNTGPSAYYPNGNLPATSIRNCEFRDDGASHSYSMRVGIQYSGVYKDCTGGDYSFGAGSLISIGRASGTFIDCTGGDDSFGSGGVASGVFIHCTGGLNSFGSSFGTAIGTASGTFTDCTGGDHSFGYYGTATGAFSNCTGGVDAFGGGGGSADGGKFYHCVGGASAFTETYTTTPPVQLFCIQNGARYSGND